MTFDEFVKRYNNKAVDYDGTSGVQCVDLAKLYIAKVIGATPQSIGDAYCYYDDYEDTYLKKYFDRIPYKKGVKPQQGDLVVWGKYYNGSSRYGHIAIATGEATGSYLYTYDENYGVKKMHKVKHNYKGLSGYLRPKNQKHIASAPKVKYGTYKTTTKLGVYRGYGFDKEMKSVGELTADGRKNATSTDLNAPAYLKKGTKVTIKETKLLSSGDLWAKIPSGRICIWKASKGKLYIK
ncbi:MAG: CHAP domain-containing protein [Eubacterium sp.]|nr:CHAP domain-containing protein [Eubacterium sp.]